MSDEWERINQALGAEMQGRSLAPHVSRQTLFGIKSDVEIKMEAIAAQSAGGTAVSREASALRGELLGIARRFGSRLVAGRADRYYIWRAREMGYDIPAYPFARSGDLAEFLSDQGVRDLPEWYARIGVTPAQYRNLAAFVVVALRDASGGRRERVVAHGAMFVDESRFVPLADDPYLEHAPENVVEELLVAVRELVES